MSGKDILNVKATRTDSAGNGYYRASDGNYYYGNVQNGYLVETEETARLKAQNTAQNNNSSYTYKSSSSSSESFLEQLLICVGIKLGMKLVDIFGPIVKVILKFIWGIAVVVLFLPISLEEYVSCCIAEKGFLFKLLSVPAFIALFVLVAYNVYRNVKGLKKITKEICIAESIVLSLLLFLGGHPSVSYLIESIFIGCIIACCLKYLSDRIDMGIHFVRTKVLKNRKRK